MQKEIEAVVDKLIDNIIYDDVTCTLRELDNKWSCDIGHCKRCEELAIRLIYQRLKEREEHERTD